MKTPRNWLVGQALQRYRPWFSAALFALAISAGGAFADERQKEPSANANGDEKAPPTATDKLGKPPAGARIRRTTSMEIRDDSIRFTSWMKVGLGKKRSKEDIDLRCSYTLTRESTEDGFQLKGGKGSLGKQPLKEAQAMAACKELEAVVGPPPMPTSQPKPSVDSDDSSDEDQPTTLRWHPQRDDAVVLASHRFDAGSGYSSQRGASPRPRRRGCIEMTDPEMRGRSPLLAVKAPVDAREVMAHFESGRNVRLAYDAVRRQWSVRVPKGLPVGMRTTWVSIAHRDGRKLWQRIRHEGSAETPPFAVRAPRAAKPGRELPLDVDPLEPVAEVVAEVPGITEARALMLNASTGHYTGTLPLPMLFPGNDIGVQITVRDLKGRRRTREIKVAAAVGYLPTCR